MGEQEIQMEQEAINVTHGGGAVNSVNGKTGDVTLTTSDLENTSDYQTGSEVESDISTAIGQLSIPTKTSQLTNDGATGTSTYVEATALSSEATARQNADNGLQGQIDALAAASDVTDIVGTKADLNAYDTSKLKDNDIIKVLQDESEDDETTYYRWNATTQTFTLIGEEGPYYTKAATDALLQSKQNTLTAGDNITIEEESGTGDLVISAVGVPTVVQTTGQSTTSVMSQKAVTDQMGGLALLPISQTDYDNLSPKDPNTLYVITGA